MSRTFLRRRERESFEVPLLPVRRTGLDLRESLARFCPPVTIHLGPGERIIGGRVYYSAAWLGPEPEVEHGIEEVEKLADSFESRLRETWQHERPELREAATS
jgi:hypothetical protein